MKPTKGQLVLILFVVAMAIWINKSTPPDSIPEQWKVKFIDMYMTASTIMVFGLSTLGITQQFSPLHQALSDQSLLFMATGWPFWKYSGDKLQVSEQWISGVRVKVYEPVSSLSDSDRPVVIFLHGGGWVVLSPEAYEPLTSKIAEDADVVLMVVDYRRSPQTPYPGPRADCLAVFNHVYHHATDMGLDPHRIALAGDSAGGNLVASLALELRDRVAIQMILVPALQAIDTLTASAIENGPYMSTSINNRLMYSAYLLYGNLSLELMPTLLNNSHVPLSVRQELGQHKLNTEKLLPPFAVRTPSLRHRGMEAYGEGPDTSRVWARVEKTFTDPYFSPLMADDDVIKRTAPCYVMTAGYDLIRDDGMMYFRRLKHAGVKGVWKNYPESFHHAIMFHSGPLKLKVGEAIVVDIVRHIKDNL